MKKISNPCDNLPGSNLFLSMAFFCMVYILGNPVQGQQTAKTPDWSGWDFLMGEWIGEGSGSPGQGGGGFSFSLDLQGHVLVRRNHTEFPALEGRPAQVHDDLLVIYQEPGSATRAVYFDNEGHVIHYRAEFILDRKGIVLISDSQGGAPRFRLTYTRISADRVRIKFEMTAPGKPGSFTTYLEGTARKK